MKMIKFKAIVKILTREWVECSSERYNSLKDDERKVTVDDHYDGSAILENPMIEELRKKLKNIPHTEEIIGDSMFFQTIWRGC